MHGGDTLQNLYDTNVRIRNFVVRRISDLNFCCWHNSRNFYSRVMWNNTCELDWMFTSVEHALLRHATVWKQPPQKGPLVQLLLTVYFPPKRSKPKYGTFRGEREVFPDMQCSKKRENIFCALVKTTKIKAEILLDSRITYPLICFSWFLFGVK